MTDTQEQTLLSMDEAIDMLKTTRPTFYRWLRSGRIKGMKMGRQWRFYADDLERFLNGVGPRVDLPTDIRPLIADLTKLLQASHSHETLFQAGELHFEQDSEAIALACELMLDLAAAYQASHLHLETLFQFEQESIVVLRFRLGGLLKPMVQFDRRLLAPVIAQFKMLASCDPQLTEQAQEGRIHFESKLLPESANVQFRAHFLPSYHGETMTLTHLQSQQVISLERLQLTSSVHKALKTALNKGWGMILTSGPTGSGKTTTLYAALNELASPEIKSISIEDPVEVLHPWVVPVALDSQAGVSMSHQLRDVLQSDPDLILIGELRDQESLELSLRLALTGHLVLSQLHSPSALQALMRLSEVSGSAYTVTEALSVVLNQRLIRKLCPACKSVHKLTTDDHKRFASLQKHCGFKWKDLPEIYQAVGCEACGQTGYKGRLQITESLSISPELSRLLHQQASLIDMQAYLDQSGFRGFLHDGVDKVTAGLSTFDELLRVAGLN